MSASRIACIVPFLNEARHLPAMLDSLAAQTADRERLYVIGVDNGSSDGSDALFERWLESGHHGELVRAAVRSIPYALNAGIARTRETDVVVRLDSHSLYAPDYVATLVDTLESLPEDVWCVGTAPQPHPDVQTYSQALVAAMYANPMALGPADFRRPHASAVEVSTVYLGAWRPGVLQRFAGFDERFAANEDCELTERLRAAGGRIYRAPARLGVIVTRGAYATIVQRARYGFWRMQTFKRYPQAVRARHVIPPLALALGCALVLSRYRRWISALYALYACAAVAGRPAGERPVVTLGTLAFFPLLQASYAAGLIAGLLRTPQSLRGPRRAATASQLRGTGPGRSQ